MATVILQSVAVGVPVTVTLSVIVVALVTVPVEVKAAPVQVPRVRVAVEENPLPVMVIGVVPATAATADGVTSLISLPLTVKTEPEVTVPPSGFVTVTVYAPIVAGEPLTEFVGSTCTVRLVELTKVAEPWHETVPPPQVDGAMLLVPVVVNVPLESLARVVPFVAFTIDTVAPETKPEPVTVTGVDIGVARSTIPAGLTEVNDGSALTTTPVAFVTVPPSSV